MSGAQVLATSHPLRALSLIVRSMPMLDVVLIAVALGFFALSIGYTIACDRL